MSKSKLSKEKMRPEHIDFKKVITEVNQIMTNCCAQIKLLNPLPFGQSIAHTDAREATDSLVAHRILSKFHIAEESERDLRQEAFAKYIEYENGRLSDVASRFNMWESGRTGFVLRHARSFLHDMFKNFHVDLKNARVELTGGESYISSNGEVSVLAKLADLDHWTTTWNCLEDTIVLVYHNLSLKRLARSHIGHVTRKYRRSLYDEYRNHGELTGFYVFRRLLIDRVLTIVDGARGSSVPKNNDNDRFINVEATFPMILQRLVAAKIRTILSQYGNPLDRQTLNGVDYNDAQEVHKVMIANRLFSTIDFSNASDSVLWKVVCALFPAALRKDLMKYRSYIVTLGDEQIEPLKLSSMGNGFTFEVMTSLLFALGRMFSDQVRVYGDDVIIPSTSAAEFIDVCAYIGFSTNTEKTFIRASFRESCGAFFHDDVGYLTSFAFGPIKVFQDVLITCNKLALICEANQISPELGEILDDTRMRIMRLIPASRRGPIPVSEELKLQNISYYAYAENWSRNHKSSNTCRTNYKLALKRFQCVFRSRQERAPAVLVYIPVYVPLCSTKTRFTEAAYAAFLYAGRNSKATVRGRGKWVDKPAFVTHEGEIYYMREIAFIKREISKLTKAIALRDAVMCNMNFNHN